jgi:hypothetical protein
MIDLFTIDTVGDGVPFGSIESTLSPKFDESYYAPLKVMIFAENCLIERLAGRSHSCVPFNSYIGLLRPPPPSKKSVFVKNFEIEINAWEASPSSDL